MAGGLYEQAMRQEAARLIAEHGELVEVRCVSGPPDYRIELEFADGHQEAITRHTGRIDITMMKFGYAGTGTECLWAFLDEAGFKDVSLERLQTMKGPQTLRRGRQPDEVAATRKQEEAPPATSSDKKAELPLWENVARDPSLLDPQILEQLEKSMCFTVRDETGPVAALIIRGSSDDFRGALTPDIPMSLHVHYYKSPAVELYGVYPIVWDDPVQPFFKETWLVGAGEVTGPPDPLSEGQLTRLERLLTQEYTYFLVVDPSNRVLAPRKVEYSAATQEYFLNLVPRVRASKSVTISNADFMSAVADYLNRVSLDEVRSSAWRLRGDRVKAIEEDTKPDRPMEVEEEPIYRWQGRSKLARIALGFWAMAQFCLCSGLAGYVMSGFDPGPIVYVAVLILLLAISGATMFEALRPTTIRQLVISSKAGLIFRRKSGKEKPVIATINRARQIRRGKAIQIHGLNPESKHVRAEISEASLEEGQFERFKEDLQRLIPGLRIEVPDRRPIVRRVLAGLCSIPAVVALFGFFVFAGATVHDYVKGIEYERIPLPSQVVIVLALFTAFVLFASLSVFLTDRRKVGIALWSVFLVLGLVVTGGIVTHLLQGEEVAYDIPSAPALEVPLLGGSPTPVPTPGSSAADQVVAYNPGLAQKQQYADPEAALGAPDLVEQPCCSGMLQLGAGGSVLLAFSDNVIYDGPGPDFQVLGESARDDFILVEVSADGQVWGTYPKVNESPEPFDLAEVGLEEAAFVRITDVQPGTPTGAELDAVEAIHSGSPLAGGLPTDLPDALARSDTTLYQGPGDAYNAVDQVTGETILAIDGCNADGSWAMVQTTDGLSGWCRVAEMGLNVSLSDYELAEIPATPTPPPPTPAPLMAELVEAQTRGLAQVTITGHGLERIQVALESLSAEPLQVIVLPGTIFQAHTTGTQNMVVRQRQVAYLPSRGSRQSLTIPAACANMELGVPEESDGFSINTAPVPEDLTKLLSLPSFLEETFRVQQFAIWTITDNPARGEYVGLGYFGVGSGPDDEEMQRIRALFEQAGIPPDRYRALQ